MSNAKKQVLQAHGRSVEVTTEPIANAVAALRIVARSGNTVVETTHTFGPVDGALVPPTADKVQQALDRAREQAARAAAHHQIVAEHVAAAT